MPPPLIYIAAGMLLLGAAPLPYGYYIFLRIVISSIFVWAAIVSSERKNPLLPWLFGFLAILFNPLIKVPFPKEVWVVMDVGAGLLLLATKQSIQQRINR